MADLTDLQAAQTIKIIGADSSGTETTPVKSDLNGSMQIVLAGNDGLYKAAVDSVGRLATNANVTFPEVFYQEVKAVNGSNANANANGTLGSPVVFRWTAPVGEAWYLEKLTFVINDNANFANNGFGGLTALTNGVLLNIKTKNTVQPFVTLKNNYEITRTFKENIYSSVAAGLFGTDRLFQGTIEFQNRIALDGSLGDYFEIQVRDNLTGLTSMYLDGLVWRLNG